MLIHLHKHNCRTPSNHPALQCQQLCLLTGLLLQLGAPTPPPSPTSSNQRLNQRLLRLHHSFPTPGPHANLVSVCVHSDATERVLQRSTHPPYPGQVNCPHHAPAPTPALPCLAHTPLNTQWYVFQIPVRPVRLWYVFQIPVRPVTSTGPDHGSWVASGSVCCSSSCSGI